MRKNYIIIYGVPHTGTSILKSMLGRCDNVNEIIKENVKVTKDLMIPNKINLVKFPLWNHNLIEQDNHYGKIFIVREPKYALSSLKRRFPDIVPNNHKECFTLEYWDNYLKRFLKAKESKDDVGIKYSDIFDRDTLKSVCKQFGIDYSDDIWGTYDRKIANCSIPTEKPDREDHLNFRQYQINQPIVNMNDDSTIYPFEDGYLESFEALDSYKKIFNK